MPRDLPLGNGSLLVAFDQSYQIRDLYWPHVGQENHALGHPFRLGVWVNGQFSWLHDARWKRSLRHQAEFEAIDLDVPAPVITLSLQRRLRSRDEKPFADKLLAAMRNQFGGHAVLREKAH